MYELTQNFVIQLRLNFDYKYEEFCFPNCFKLNEKSLHQIQVYMTNQKMFMHIWL